MNEGFVAAEGIDLQFSCGRLKLINEKKKQAGLEKTALHISETERRSIAAERDPASRYIAVCFSERIGERLDRCITDVSCTGLFIRPHASVADGFASVVRLPGGYYRFESSRFAMVVHSRGQSPIASAIR